MLPLADAQARILEAVEALPARVVALRDALGLVLATDVIAPDPVPPFANTAMDGYAVRAVDTATAPVTLRVVGDLPAGRAPTTAVGAGEAIRIMTGAPMPDGADAVVMVERTEPDGSESVRILAAARPGDHVRPAAGDVEAGETVFGAGTLLRPAHVGVLASVDHHEVTCIPRARVGVISTGDELVARGPLAPGQIRDSNRPMLLACLAEAGCDPVDYGSVRDDEPAIEAALTAATSECDAVLTSGAVSVGDYDFVKLVLERLARSTDGGRYLWAQVAIKPAKPLAFAMVGGVPVFGLPGNPVSSRVSFELFARPALRARMGRREVGGTVVRARATGAMSRKRDGKLHLDRVRVRVAPDGRYECERAGSQASNVLSAMAAANGLALLDDGDGVQPGDEVRVLLLGPD